MNMQPRLILVVGTALTLCSAQSVLAQLITGDDLVLEDATPDIVFDDTDASSVRTYRIRGFKEYFLIRDESDSTSFFRYDPLFNSLALGWQSEASSSGSIAAGTNAVASGFSSAAVGHNASSSGEFSLAVGLNAESTGDNGTALGHNASASGAFSTALGFGADVLATHGLALGKSSRSQANFSTAVGSDSLASGLLSTGVGFGTFASGERSAAIGAVAAALGFGSVALGEDSSSQANFSTSVGADSIASGLSSTALGQATFASGERSTAIGARAVATEIDTIVLGSIPGVLTGFSYVNVANGTLDPQAPLHIFRDDDTREFLYLESNEAATNQDRAMMYLVNNGGIRFEFANQTLGTAWRFQAATGNDDNFEIAKVGTGEIEFKVDADGNVYAAGLVFENSDRNAKTNIQDVDAQAILDRVVDLPISEWAYRESPESRHIGPMAQDFHAAFETGTSEKRLATMDGVGVAIASIQALEQRNRELENQVAELKTLVQELLAQN